MFYKSPRGNKDDIKDFWSRNISHANLSENEKGTREFFEEVEKARHTYYLYYLPPLFKKIAMNNDKGRLLEVGCGMGIDLLKFAELGFEVTGIDLSEASIKMARKRFEFYNYEANLGVADAEKLPFYDGRFDVVWSFAALPYTPNPKIAISEIHRVLNKGGKVFAVMYNRYSLNYFAHWVTGMPFDGSRKDKCPVEKAYSKKEVGGLFKDFSSVKIRIKYLYGPGWGIIYRVTPRFIHSTIGKYLGWHTIIEATK